MAGGAQAAGLTVNTETFSFAPNLAFPVGPATFTVDPLHGRYNHTRGWLESDNQELRVGFTAGSFVFGLGYDYTFYPVIFSSDAFIGVTDVDNVEQGADSGDFPPYGFLGIIGTSAFEGGFIEVDDGNLFVVPDSLCTVDDLSVAYAVPESGAGLLLGLAMAGLSALRKRHRAART
jgi:hypothetical protein